MKDLIFSESYIVEVAGSLYISTWRNALESVVTQNATYQDIWRVDYALTTATALGLNSLAVFNVYQFASDFFSGFSNLVTDGTFIYGRYGVGATYIFKLNPSIASPYGASKLSWGVGENKHINDLALDVVNSTIWSTGTDVDKVAVSLNTIGIGEQRNSTTTVPTTLGVCVVPGTPPKVYYACGSATLRSAAVASAYDAFPPTSFNAYTLTSLAILDAAAQPMRIRYNPNNSMVYIPGWSNDKVEIMNPATDTITAVKTGFTSPIDVVFTPTKAFAIQDSSVGLLEIT